MDLINKINDTVSDEKIEEIIRKAIPHTIDREEVAFMRGYVKGGQQIRNKIIQLIIDGKYS